MNAGSNLGRLSYSAHMLFYPTAFVLYQFVYKPYSAAQNEKAKKADWEALPKARKVDRDIFNPFTPIPFHNNRELKYAYAHINMLDYVNENHVNVKDYPYKQYHNSYSEDNEYLYNWTSTSSYNH
ncbi:unnamed protein product [Moneuplotes crassus]|uniref:Uncharacterized protein n=1 Tax=Euplotes crassus TaxID=5936 RepID=A0AAD2D9Z9_EUPCR|nr:unnamed protein product [Moneuplotes crassus]